MSVDLIVRGERVFTPVGERPLAIHIDRSRGVIVAVTEPAAAPAGIEVIDAGSACVLPGLVDTHVHINDPGRTEWEGFETATRAAAAGGITTIIDMPLNSLPPTTDVAALDIKRKTAQGKVFVDVGFWGGAVPGNADALRDLYDAGG